MTIAGIRNIPTPYTSYEVTGNHASAIYASKKHVITVYYIASEGFFCDSPILGCSRTYDVQSASEAVNLLMREHGYYLVRFKEINLL